MCRSEPCGPSALILYRDERLNFLRAGQSVVNQSAILVRALVELSHRRQAEMRQVVLQLFEIFSAQHLHFARIGTAGDAEAFYGLRRLFAIRVKGDCVWRREGRR